MDQLEEKVVVVTGGGSGIGRGLVRAFAAEGARVVVADIELDAAAAVAEEVGGVATRVDTRSLESVRDLADFAYNEFGRVDVLCNNAGVSTVGSILDTTVDDWRWMFDVNVFGPIHGVIAFLPRMIAQSGPKHIVNTGSIAGLVPLPGISGYSTSKYAVVGLSESLANEVAAHDVGVTVICPGSVRTRIVEADRNRPPEYATTGHRLEAREISPGEAIDPDTLGEQVVGAVKDNQLYVFAFSTAKNNLEMPGMVRERFAAIEKLLPQ